MIDFLGIGFYSQHIKDIIPLFSGFHWCYWEVTFHLSFSYLQDRFAIFGNVQSHRDIMLIFSLL
jgi:hypothetical protein